MRAWLLSSLGGIDKIALGDAPDPSAAGEAVVKLIFAGLNPADRYLAEGQYPARPSFPHILGRDGLGVIESLGSPSSEFKVGDKVAIVRSDIGVNRAGTFAQRVAVPIESLVHPPADWSDEQAGGATLVYLTAYQAITQWPDLPGDCVTLITAHPAVLVSRPLNWPRQCRASSHRPVAQRGEIKKAPRHRHGRVVRPERHAMAAKGESISWPGGQSIWRSTTSAARSSANCSTRWAKMAGSVALADWPARCRSSTPPASSSGGSRFAA